VISKLFQGRNAIFSAPMWPPMLLGTIITVVFYGLIYLGPLDFPLLRRYCLCHAVAIVTVAFFFISCVALVSKFIVAFWQSKLVAEARHRLSETVAQSPKPCPTDPSEWLMSMWRLENTKIFQSWLGLRLTELLNRQQKRGSSDRLDEDLRELADRDADAQHESYGMVRIATWAMPMLGFLGTVLGISETLGQMDTQKLASGSQEAMNNMTAGLYVAFDTTAIALVLTIGSMFIQFIVGRIEQKLLVDMEQALAENLVGFLAQSKEVTPNRIEELLDRMTNSLRESFQSLVAVQADLWSKTIDEAHSRWSQLTDKSSETIQHALTSALDESLDKHTRYLETAQAAGAAQIDSRWQQWQTSFSEQSRLLHVQQREVMGQTELLKQILEKGSDLEQLDEALEQNLKRMTDVDRFHEAAICMTEAVAFLGTQLERHGFLSKTSKSPLAAPETPTVSIRRRAA
jgi:biopolymer transport protein ExbB/TolQ